MALPAAAVLEVRTTGSDSNGGGFNAARGGTDYSQQDAAQASGTATVSGTTLTATTGIFTSAMVGNYVTDGTSWREITAFTSSTAVTIDATVAWTGATVNVGGALLTPGKACNTVAVGSNTIWIKSGTYIVAAAITPPSGVAIAQTQVYGYNSARGDLDADSALYANFPLLQNNNTTNNIVDCLSNIYIAVANLIGDGGSGASKAVRCFSAGGNTNVSLRHLKAMRFTTFGVLNQSNGAIDRCWATQGTSATTAAIRADNGSITDCYSNANAGPGFVNQSSAASIRCISDSNTGVNGAGHIFSGGSQVENCVAYKNATNGFQWSWGGGVEGNPQNNISYGNGTSAGYGFNLTGIASSTVSPLRYNATGSNSSGAYNLISGGTGAVALSGDPFVNPTGAITSLADVWANFALNATAGAGAACRAAGYPSYLDIGAVQHQDSGGGSSGGFVFGG